MSDEPVLTKIAENKRGASWSIMLPNGQELILIRTNKGFWRGGHSHNVIEASVLLSGRIRYWKLDPPGVESQFDVETGSVLHNAPGAVHLALALEDYWLIDLRPGSKASDIKSTNYPPYRKFVDEQPQATR